MKISMFAISFLGLILSGSMSASVAYAKEDAPVPMPVPTLYKMDEEGSGKMMQERGVGAGKRIEMDEQESSDDEYRERATTSMSREHRASSSTKQEDDDEAIEDSANRGRGDEHKREVAKFVHTLLDVADRDGGIGEEVRKIANEQASSSEKVADAADKASGRGKMKTFLIGSDYKNIGVIRSEIAGTANRIEKLDRELMKAASSTDVSAVKSEIESLKQEQTTLSAFIRAHEDKFSLFGWLARMF